MTEAEGKSTWRFPRTFWIANVMELFERAAYYGCFIFLTVFLTKRVGFTDVEAGFVTGAFSFLLYFLPTFMGVLADRIGFKRAIVLAYALLALGYGVLGAFPTKPSAILALSIILVGGAINKPVISGTTAKCSDEVNRARAFSIFYWVVNIGAFFGKSVVDPIRLVFMSPEESGFVGLVRGALGNPMMEGAEYQYVNLYAAVMALCGLLFAVLFYKNPEDVGGKEAETKKLSELVLGLKKVLANWRFLSLIVITGLFWCIQGQLYATMPKYLFRMVGLDSKPGWIANVNPLTVVLLVIPITHLVRKIRPVSSIGIGFLIIPLSALSVAIAPMLGAKEVSLGFTTVNTIILMMMIGIVFQGVAECFLSPRFLEYASKQAPEGEVGLYMGYSHLNAGFGWLFGFVISGYLLDVWCPDPSRLPEGITAIERASYYAHAHYIWYVFTAIGVLGFVLLAGFRALTDRIDRTTGRAEADPDET